MTAHYDVAIVGYGPVGQSLATLLGRRGWSVVVFDKQSTLYPLPRACHLDHEAMRILQAMGIADEIDEAIVPAREYLLLRPDLSVISDLPRGWETPSGWESSYHFYQPDVEVIFDSTAKATPGVTVRQGVAVRSVEDRGDDVLLEVTPVGGGDESAGSGDEATPDARGEAERVTARFVIGADGANSLVRRQAQIAHDDLGFEATWVVVDVEVKDGHELPKVPDTGQVLDPAGPTHMAWIAKRYFRWEFMIVDGADPDVASLPEHIWPKLARWVTPETATLIRSTAYTFRSLVAETFNDGRVLLAGDAAHVMPPFMGQGMVSGMRDAVTLSWMLDLVLRDAAPVGFLDEYTSSRRSHVTAYIRESVRVGQLVCETDPVKAAERDRVLEAQTEPTPPFQPPVGGFFVEGSPLAGRLSVQPRVVGEGAGAVEAAVGSDDAAGRLLDDVLGSPFALLTVEVADVEGLGEPGVAADAVERLGLVPAVVTPAVATVPDAVVAPALDSRVRVVTEQESRFADWLRDAGASWVLVRPDGYVYDAGAGREALESSLATLLVRVTSGSGVEV